MRGFISEEAEIHRELELPELWGAVEMLEVILRGAVLALVEALRALSVVVDMVPAIDHFAASLQVLQAFQQELKGSHLLQEVAGEVLLQRSAHRSEY